MKQSWKVIPLIVFAGMLLHPPVAHGDVALSLNASAPTSDIVVSHFVGAWNFAEPWRWIGDAGNDHRDLGQSFLVPGSDDVYLDAITLWVRNVYSGVPGAAFTLEIWTASGPLDQAGDALVNSQTGILPSSGLTSGYWTFDIADVQLTAGQYYLFIFAFNDGPVANRQVNFVEDYMSGYANGRAVGRAGTPLAWSTVTNDLCFWLQGSTTPPVPLSPFVGVALALVLIITGVWAMRRTLSRPIRKRQ